MSKLYRIDPYYEPRMWGGGTRLRDKFGYHTQVAPLGEVYNVVALPGHADCGVPELGCTLSELYRDLPALFDCDTQELPIRVNILDPIDELSIQIHPDDVFAATYNGGRGKPEAWVILDAPKDATIEFGHHATTREQFETWTQQGQWDKLLRYLPARVDGFIDIPVGTLHAIGAHVVKALKAAFPNLCVLADAKIMDGGVIEAQDLCEAGADIVTVLAVSDNATIKDVADVCHQYGRKAMADMICVPDIAARAQEVIDLGIDYVCVHTGVDAQAQGRTPLKDLEVLLGAVDPSRCAVAGGISLQTLDNYLALHPAIVIAGGSLYNAPDIAQAAKELKEAMR